MMPNNPNNISEKQNRYINFLVAGTQKGGTTALDCYLRLHQDILMATDKEVHFFDNEDEFQNVVNYGKYHQYFGPFVEGKVVGESTPIYMYWYDAPRRIWEYNPKMKFVLVLRNPIERAYSHWNMERKRGKENLSFWDAIVNEETRCRDALPLQHRTFSYADRGFYVEQLRRIWHYFPRQQVLVIRHEQLRGELRKVLNMISSFLKISEFPDLEPTRVHSGQYESQISGREVSFLRDLFHYDVKQLGRLLNMDFSDWLE